ncbi:Hypothetical predicted protein [Mytilus galloprovincialis]|uniref:Uncharacterized protein n=1 Tax=Mytilus galloprovincialis TaxID=29158 RepID=A0A8B6EYW2_MYTGA|nr:Hypothetical predicted protein [Mytilus galloprovincialis]
METIVPSVSNPADVAIDSLYEHLYWTERIRGGGIGRCNYDGSNITVIMKEDYIWSVTLDLENSWMYYNMIGIGIKRASLNGSDREIIQLKKHQIVAVTFGMF